MTHSVQAMVWPVVSLPAKKKMKYSCTCSRYTSLIQSLNTALCKTTCLMPCRRWVKILSICSYETVELCAAQWDQMGHLLDATSVISPLPRSVL